MLAAMVCLALLPAPAWAAGRTAEAVCVNLLHSANGPSGDTSGGSNDSAHLWICNTETGVPTTQLYNAYGSVNDSADGAVYDLASNTLSLTNYNGVGAFLEARAMGEDFTIRLAGSSALDVLLVYGTGYGGSLHIVGDGSLTVNETGNAARFLNSDAQNPIYEDGLRLYAGGGSAKLTVSAESALTVRGYNNGEAIAVKNTTEASGGIDGNPSDGTVRRTSPRVGPVQAQPENQGDEIANFAFLCEKESGLYGVQQSTYYNNGTPVSQYAIYNLTKTETGYTYGTLVRTLASEKAIAEAGYSIIYEEGRYIYEVVDETGAPLSIVSFTPTGAGLPTITTTSLPSGKVGEAYTATLSGTAADGSTLSWSVEGSLPSGLALNAETGVISGTPTAAGSFSFAVKATQGDGKTATKSLSISVSQPVTYTVRFDLNGGTATPGADYSAHTGVADGAAITLPAAPARMGYDFGGWSDGVSAYAAGAQYTVTGTVTLQATWREQSGLSLTLPAGMEDLIGSVWLNGTCDNESVYLWGDWYEEPTAVAAIEVPMRVLWGRTFTALELFAYVDGGAKCIARYNGAAGAGDKITMTAGTPYTILSEIHVTGLTENVDYLLSSVTKGEERIYSVPCLVTPDSTWQISLCGVRGSPVYTLIDWSREYTVLLQDHKLTVSTEAAHWGDPTVALTGAVTWANGGRALPYGTVRATQKVGDVYRTLQTVTRSDGSYSLLLYPNTPAAVSLQSGGALYIVSPGSGGASYTLGVGTSPITLDLSCKWVTLTTSVTLGVSEDTLPTVLSRYLEAGEKGISIYAAAGSEFDVDLSCLNAMGETSFKTFLHNTGAADALRCTIASALFESTARDAQRAEGDWTVSFTPTLRPGVVVLLNAAETMGACFAYYDAAGACLGCSDAFSIITTPEDVAQPCPADTAHVALLPSACMGTLGQSTFRDVTADGRAMKTWDVAMAPGKITALAAFCVDETTSANALYVTLPNSAIATSADSFISEQDLIRFSGSIGLDNGLDSGSVTRLYLNPVNEQASSAGTAVVQSITVGGRNYPAQQATAFGYYVFEFSEPIPLPCDYTVYCTPGSRDLDMHVTLTADVSWSGGSAGSQLIGSAVVARPGAYLDTLSTYVNQKTILVSGVSRADEAVTIYDGGAVIGTARGDCWGEWTAQVTLDGTDDSVPTAHRLYAASASGAVSDVLTVLHDSAGPQLTRFTMSWRDGEMTTINIGDAYVFRGAMYDTTFEAAFTNPGALTAMPAWDCKVVFKVFTADGEVRFLEATESGGVFTAKVPTTLSASVTRAEVLCVPALHTGFDLSAMCGSAPAADSAQMKAVAAEVKADHSDYRSYVYALTYDSKGKASAKALDGTAADPDFVKNLEESAGNYPDKGLVISYVSSDANYATPTEEWLRLTAVDASIQNWYALRIGNYASECRMYTLSRRYTGGTDSAGKALSAAEVFELEKAYFDGLAAVHSVFTLDDGRYDLYTVETEGTGLDGAPYLDRYVTAAFAAVDGVYTSSFTVTYSDRVCLKPVREKLDEMYPQARSSAAAVETAASGAGTANAVLLNAASGAPIRLMDEGQTEEQPTLVAEVEVRYSSNFTPEMHAELEELRWERDNLDCIFDIQSERRLAQLEHAEANAMEPTWLDENHYHYNGSFKPESQASRSAMNRVQYSMGNLESYSGDANSMVAITTAIAGESSLGASLGPAGAATAVANIYANGVNTRDAKEELELMRGDMEQIMSSPCYHKLTQSQRDMVDEAYGEFMQWYGIAHNHLQGVAQCNFAASSGGVLLGKNPISGLVMAGSGLMVSNVGGKMVDSSFGSAIFCYEQGFAKIKGVLRARSKQLDDPNCKGKPVSTAGPTDGNGKNNKPTNDPSGVIYEGVIENPVQGATVTLYYGADADGRPVTDAPTQLKPATDVRTLIPNTAVQVTGADGRFRWGVPEGLWYVTTQYAGLTGDSNDDTAATVAALGKNLLPVLPVQLDVNIPLVDPSAPTVTDVQYTTEGIYVTFSKYMDEADVLSAASYCVYAVGADTTPVPFSVTWVEQGHTPANRGVEKTYTRTVLLAPATAQAEGTKLSVEVRGSVKSYAGTTMGADWSGSGTAAQKKQLAKPALAPASGEVARGSIVTITGPEGAAIYYSTDGSAPSRLYENPVAITSDMTVKALARRPGYADSEIVSGSYTVPRTIKPEPEEPVTPAYYGDYEEPAYVPTITEPEHGKVTVKPEKAASGETVTITITPDEGYELDALIVTDASGKEVAVTKNADGTFSFKQPAGKVTIKATFKESVAPERPFEDVKEADWFYDAVYYCFDKGYFKGTGTVTFSPKETMTRAMFATVLWRIAGEPAAEGGKSFNDVEDGKWYTDAVLWASGEGILDGYGDGTFGTNDPVTREQMVALLWRYSGKPAGTADLSGYKDADQISDWAREAFAWAVSVGLVQGKGDGILDPGGKATRAEVAQIVMNYDTKVK